MKKSKSILTTVAIIITILGIAVASSAFLLSKKYNFNTMEMQDKFAFEKYNELTYDDSAVDATNNVKFYAFFTKDLKDANGNNRKDGIAEKYDGTCNHLTGKDTLFIDLNVLTEGYFENGKITINSNNFKYSMYMIADSVVLKKDYISDDVKEIEINKMYAGTQKIIFGKIKSDIGNDTTNYSKEVTITLTGTYVDDYGNVTPIEKTCSLNIDWYGVIDTKLSIPSASTYYYDNMSSEQISFTVNTYETKNELLLKDSVVTAEIPLLNGYEPTSVICTSAGVQYEYDSNSRIITIIKSSTVNSNGIITKSLSRSNSYTIQVSYPKEAYKSMTSATNLSIPVKAQYVGYNNPNEEFNSIYSYLANVDLENEPDSSYPSNIANGTVTISLRETPKVETPEEETPEPVTPTTPTTPIISKVNRYFGVEIKEKKYVTSPVTGYVLSKQNWLDYLEGLSTEGKYNYTVRWYAYSGNVEKLTSYTMSETKNGENESYGDKFDSNVMDKYIVNTGIYFGNPTSVLGSSGKIRVYNDDTGELIHTFTAEDWNMYSASNPYRYSSAIKHIRVETTAPNASTTFSVYHIKELDIEKLKEDYTRNQIFNFGKLYTYLTGEAGVEENGTYSSNCLDYVYLISNTVPSSFEVIISSKTWNSLRYVMSKQDLINYRDDNTYNGNYEYVVNWQAYSGNIEAVTSYIMTETSNGANAEYGDTIDARVFAEYTNNKGIYFSGATAALGSTGEIRVYNNDTNELIHTFTLVDWGKYTRAEPYIYDQAIKHIRIETSAPRKETTLNVYHVKEFDAEKIAQNYTRDQIYQFSLMTTYLTGKANLKFNGEKVTKDTDSVHLIANSNSHYFDVTIANKKYIERDISGYAISKQNIFYLYNNPYYDGSYEYTVDWKAYSGNIEPITSFTMAETVNGEGEEYGDKINQTTFSQYIYNKGIYFSNATATLSNSGEIRVYNNDTGELIHIFTAEDWGKYTSSNPYRYDEEIKHIRVETSAPLQNQMLHIYNIKEFDAEKIVENFSKDDVYNWERITTYLTGTANFKFSGEKVSKDSDSAYTISDISDASISLSTDLVKTTETIREKIYINTIYTKWGDSYWQDGQFIVEVPKDIVAINVNDVRISNSNVKILGYEVFRKDGKSFVKIITQNSTPTVYQITIDCEITPDSTIQTSSDTFKLYAYNKAGNDYYNMGKDLYDVNSNNNTQEMVGVATAKIDYIAPTVIVTLETVSNYDADKNITIAPNVAPVERANKQATINISLMNNYPFTATGIKILGRIPFEGNRYIIDNKDLKSEFSTTMTSDGVHGETPELDNAMVVYYSENENATRDLADESNGWMLASQVSDYSKIKSYLIDLQEYGVSNIPIYFNYNIKIPEGIDYNKVSYSDHAVFYDFVTEGGRVSFQTEPAKVGVRIVDKFNLNINKYKINSDTINIPAVVYSLNYKEKNPEGELEDKSRIITTNNEGRIEIKDLYLDVDYTLKEIDTPDTVELSSDEIHFKINKNGQLELSDNVRNYTFENDDTLTLDLEDEVRYKLKIGKFKTGTDTVVNNVKFNLRDEDGNDTVVKTVKGVAEIKGLYLNKTYTLTENVTPWNIEVNEGVFKFKLVRNSENSEIEVVVEENTLITGNPIITDREETLSPELYVKVENEIKYNLNLSKLDLDENKIDGVQFKISGKGLRDGGETRSIYNGTLNISGLYVGETYILEEVKAVGYYLDKEKNNTITFKVARGENGLEVEEFVVGNGLIMPEQFVPTVSENKLDANLDISILNEKIPTYNLKIRKENDEGNILPGAQFKLTSLEYGIEKNVTIDENGEGTFSGLYMYVDGKPFDGLYTIEETYAPEGYRLEKTALKFYVSKGEDGNLVVNTVEGDKIVKDIIIDDENSSKDFVTTENDVTVTIVNNPIFSLIKYGDNNIKLSDTIFAITDLDGNAVTGSDGEYVGEDYQLNGTTYKVLRTDENGKISANLGEGLYKVKEIATKTGYKTSSVLHYFGIGASRPGQTSGNIDATEWLRRTTPEYMSEFNDVIETSDGGMIAVGCTDNRKGAAFVDGIVVKYNKDGSVAWTKMLENDGDSELCTIARVSHDVYAIAGYTQGSNIKYGDTNLSELNSWANEDAIILKIADSNDGELLWSHTIGGRGSDRINDIAVNENGDIGVVGRHIDCAVTGVSNSNSRVWLNDDTYIFPVASGVKCGFVAVYDSNGNLNWYKNLTAGVNEAYGKAITSTSDGFTVAVNFQAGSLSFGGSEAIATKGLLDGVVVSYDNNGAVNWYTQIGSSACDEIYDLTTYNDPVEENQKDIVIVGAYGGSLYAVGTNVTNKNILYTATNYDGMIVKLNETDGSFVKAMALTGNQDDVIDSVVTTSDGGLLLGGWLYSSSLKYRIGTVSSATTISNMDDSTRNDDCLNSDGFVLKIDSEDKIKFAQAVKGTNFEQVNGIAEGDKCVYVVGDYNSKSLRVTNRSLGRENPYKISGFAVKYIETLVEAEVPELKELEVRNELLEYNITTEIGLNNENQRKGGTITGVNNSSYTGNVKYVETVKYGYDSTKDIVITPSSGYNVKTIRIDGNIYDFVTDDEGKVIIPAGYFKDVKANHHVVVVFESKDKSIKIIKTGEDGSRLKNAKFRIESNNDTPELEEVLGEIVESGASKNHYYANKEEEENLDVEWNDNGLEYIYPDKSNEITGVVGPITNNGGTHTFAESNGVYTSNNYWGASTNAYAYFKIDLRNYTGTYCVAARAAVLQDNEGTGYAAVTTTTEKVDTGSTVNKFIYLSGRGSSGETEREYITTEKLEGGKIYYLHIAFVKHYAAVTGIFRVSGIKVYPCTTASYNFIENDGKYIPNNKNVVDKVANSYIPIDLREKTGKYAIVVNGEINAASNEYLYATVTQNTTRPSNSNGSFMYISGNKPAKDYEKILDGGKLYYLHLVYGNKTTDEKNVAINSVKLYGTRTYYFEGSGGVYESNNSNKNNTYAESYIPIDLTNHYGRYTINLNAELQATDDDIAYAMLTTTTDVPENSESNRFFSLSGEQSAKDYSITVTGGMRYYLHLVYYNGDSDATNEDKLKINTITFTPVVETYNGITNFDGTAIVKLNYYGKYKVQETEAPEHYIISEQEKDVEVTPSQNNATVTFQNRRKPTVTVHHYLKDEEGNLTENKVAEDEVTEYLPGDFYVTYYRDDLNALNIQKDENNSIILPINASGNIGNDDVEVNYYYEAGSIKLTIHHYLEGTEDRLADDVYEYANATVDFVEDYVYTVTANGAYLLNENAEYNNLTKDYILTSIVINKGNSVDDNDETEDENWADGEYVDSEELSLLDILSNPFLYHQNAEITYYYKLKTHTITTQVQNHVESRTNEISEQKEDIFVDGGSITGEYNETYPEENNIKFVEEVNKYSNATQDITATPNEHYTVKYIKLISNPEGEEPTEKLIYGTVIVKNGEDTTTLTAETIDGVTVSEGAEGKVTISALSNITANKHFIVEFAPIEGTVTVHHIIRNKNPEDNIEHSTVQLSDLVDEPYITGPIDIEDYRMVESSSNTSGNYTEDNIDVYYYYELDSYEYSIQYYYDGVLDDTKTETGLTAKYGEKITDYPDKAGNYTLDRTEKNPLFVGEDASKNVMKIYYKSQYNITTEIRKHTEITTDPTSGEEVEIEVKGGTITGEGDTPYELVDYKEDAKNEEIKATPNDGYIVKSITVVSTNTAGTVTSSEVIYGENAVENPEIVCTLSNADNSVTLANFTNVTENKNIIVEFIPQYKVTTSVIPHDETTVNPSTSLPETNSVAGGTISGGTSATPYEEILLGGSNQKQIIVTPDENYVIATLEINGTQFDFKSEAETNDKLTYNELTGTLTFAEGCFTDVYKDIDVKVGFRKKTKVIVKHYERAGDTFKTEPLAASVEIDGYDGKSYTTSRVEIANYRDAKDQDENITPSNATGTMTLDTIEVIYYYEKIPAGVTVKHLEKVIDDATGTVVGVPIDNVPNESKTGYVGEGYTTERQSINKYVPASPAELPAGSENLIYVAQNDNATTGTYTSEPVTVVYWYERQFNITTEVKPHDELRTDAADGQKKTVSVDGGTISGQNATPYEVVVYNNNSTNEIKATPNENYIVESIKVVTIDRNGEEVSTQVVYGENKAQNPEITATLDENDNSVTLTNFSNVKNDKKVVVEFKALEGKVTVHHYINGTTTKVPANNGGVIDDEEFTDYIGETYTTSSSEDIPSIYECVSSVGNTNGTFAKDDIEVTYYYDYKYYPYTIEYYYDNVIDNSKTVSGDDIKAKYGTVISEYPTEGKTKIGFDFDHDDGKPLTITDNVSTNIIKVYYTSTKVDYLVQKTWNNIAEANTENYESTFTLMKKVGEGDAVPVRNTTGNEVTGKIIGNGTYKFENLLEYENEVKVKYSVVESNVKVVGTSAVASVNVQYDNSEEYKAVVTNTLLGSFGLNINKTEDVTNGPLSDAKFTVSIKDENNNELVTATAENAEKVFTTGSDGALTETIPAINIPNEGKTYTVTIAEIGKVTGYRQLPGTIEFQATSKLSNDKTHYILTPQTKNVLNTKGVVIAEEAITVNVENVKDLSYTVNYYYDGVINPDKTDVISTKFGDVIESFEDKVITGYKLEKVTPAKQDVAEEEKDKKVELNISDDSSANVINVYYIKDDFEYRVEYYYDGIIDNNETVSGEKATFKSEVSINADEVKTKDGKEYKKTEEENNPLEITSVAENNVIKIYYTSQFNISTKVIVENEEYANRPEGERIVENVKGGSISGDSLSSYEKVLKGGNNTKQIIITPDEGYEIVFMTLNGENFDYKAISEVNNKVKIGDDGVVTIDKEYFTNMNENKHIEVKFRKKSKVIVKYLEEGTKKVLFTTTGGDDFVEYVGYEGKDFVTEHKIIPTYADSTRGITVGEDGSVDDYSRVQIISDGNNASKVAVGKMYADEITIIYWYTPIKSNVVERHIEIDENGETKQLYFEEKNGYINAKVQTNRKNLEGLIPVNGVENDNPNVIVATKDDSDIEVTFVENAQIEVWYYYEKQFSITAKVKTHTEVDENGESIEVDGGAIYIKDKNGNFVVNPSGNKVEDVLNKGNSKSEILIKPEDGYRVKSIWINGTKVSLDNFIINTDESITLKEGYLKEVSENIVIEVEFERIPAVVIVKYVDFDTGEEISPSDILEGYVNHTYKTERNNVEGYIAYSEIGDNGTGAGENGKVQVPENAEGTFTKDDITVVYYYVRQFKISTEVIEHYEDEINPVIEFVSSEDNSNKTETGGKILVKGGKISGDGESIYETVNRGNANTKEIQIIPDEGYRIKYIKVKQPGVDDEKINIEQLLNTKGKITLPVKYFENIQSDKHLIVEFERIPATLVVNYLDKDTNDVIAKTEIVKGYYNSEYRTSKKEIEYYEILEEEYPENAEGIMTGDTVVNYWYRKLLFNMKVDKKITSVKVNGIEELNENGDFVKVSISNTELNKTSIQLKYSITVTNTGEIAGSAKVVEYIPTGFIVSKDMNENWIMENGNCVITTGELKPGETAEYEIVLDWDTNTRNVGVFENVVKIEDLENVPKFDEYDLEDNTDSSVLLIEIRTGDEGTMEQNNYILGFTLIAIGLTTIMGCEVYFRRKRE